jgi:hypothetical protein
MTRVLSSKNASGKESSAYASYGKRSRPSQPASRPPTPTTFVCVRHLRRGPGAAGPRHHPRFRPSRWPLPAHLHPDRRARSAGDPPTLHVYKASRRAAASRGLQRRRAVSVLARVHHRGVSALKLPTYVSAWTATRADGVMEVDLGTRARPGDCLPDGRAVPEHRQLGALGRPAAVGREGASETTGSVGPCSETSPPLAEGHHGLRNGLAYVRPATGTHEAPPTLARAVQPARVPLLPQGENWRPPWPRPVDDRSSPMQSPPPVRACPRPPSSMILAGLLLPSGLVLTKARSRPEYRPAHHQPTA